jgi:hypothetical protein
MLRAEQFGAGVQAGSEAHSTSYAMDIGVSPPLRGIEHPRRAFDISSQCSAEVKTEESYISYPTVCIHGMDSDNFAILWYKNPEDH